MHANQQPRWFSVHQLLPSLFQPFHAHWLRGAQLLRKEAHPQFFEQPSELGHACIGHALALGHQAPILLLEGFEFCQLAGIARCIGANFVQAQHDGFEVARKVLQLRVGCVDHKAFTHQALQLQRAIGHCVRMRFGVFDLSARHAEFSQPGIGQTRHFIGNQRQAPSPFVNALFEAELIRWQRVHEEGTV